MVSAAVLVVLALIAVNAVYVAAEFAAVSVRRSRVSQLASDGNPLARWLLPLIESPIALDRYIAACQIGITISSLVLGAYAQLTFAVWLAPVVADALGVQPATAQSAATVTVLLFLTAAQVIFAELVPKSLALRSAERYSLLIGPECGAHTFPYVEVKNDTAQVEHEASTSKVSDDQLFYCRQRGLTEEDASTMIVNGFCREVFDELPMEYAVEAQALMRVSLEGAVG